MTIGLSMIVKNESEVLARALDSVAGAVDEIVIVDTGSTDGTADIARGYTDRVFSMKWRDDFSLARNYALSLVKSDYWLWLDADDVVPPQTARYIKRLKKGDGDFDVVMLPYVLSFDQKGRAEFYYYRERIIRNRPDFCWRGAVHEAVELHGKIIRGDMPIVHAKPIGRQNGGRNLAIYRKLLASGKKLTPRERYYYARELMYNGEVSEACDQLKLFIDGEGGYDVNKADGCLLLARCLGELGRAGESAAVLRSFEFAPPSGEGCCMLGATYFERGEIERAAFWYECALRCDKRPSDRFTRAEYCDFVPLVWLSVCYFRLGKLKKAYSYHKRALALRPTDPTVQSNDKFFKAQPL